MRKPTLKELDVLRVANFQEKCERPIIGLFWAPIQARNWLSDDGLINELGHHILSNWVSLVLECPCGRSFGRVVAPRQGPYHQSRTCRGCGQIIHFVIQNGQKRSARAGANYVEQ